MPERRITVNNEIWTVSSTGRITQYTKDEFGLRFTRVMPAPPVERIVRYSPQGAKRRETALSELTDAELAALFRVSQPGWTTPETGYRR